MKCVVCGVPGASPYRSIAGVQYLECGDCRSLFADPAFLSAMTRAAVKEYDRTYWEEELRPARDRAYGSSLARVAETFCYCRIAIERFIDIGSGPGYLLDALQGVLPQQQALFHGVELFPPEQESRSTHPNYRIGTLGDLEGHFQAGVCIEVIEHLQPDTLRQLLAQLAHRSSVGAMYYFSSGQPEYVKGEDPDYLDPLVRGHIIAYSLKGLRPLFAAAGFQLIPLPGRSWAFLAEYLPEQASLQPPPPTADELLNRLWTMLPANQQKLSGGSYGPMMQVMGIESARCYLEHAQSTEARRPPPPKIITPLRHYPRQASRWVRARWRGYFAARKPE